MGPRCVYPENETGTSVLAPDQQFEFVRHDESAYRVRVQAGTATEFDFRYEVTGTAESTRAYAGQLGSTYGFALPGFSSGEREVVEWALTTFEA